MTSAENNENLVHMILHTSQNQLRSNFNRYIEDYGIRREWMWLLPEKGPDVNNAIVCP